MPSKRSREENDQPAAKRPRKVKDLTLGERDKLEEWMKSRDENVSVFSVVTGSAAKRRKDAVTLPLILSGINHSTVTYAVNERKEWNTLNEYKKCS